MSRDLLASYVALHALRQAAILLQQRLYVYKPEESKVLMRPRLAM